MERLKDDDWLVPEASDELVRKTSGRRSVLIFASGVQHAQHIVEVLRAEHGGRMRFRQRLDTNSGSACDDRTLQVRAAQVAC